MPLIIVRDAKSRRERILNTGFIFEVREEGERLRINYAEGAQGRDWGRDCVHVEGAIAEFAKQVGAVRVG